MAFNDYWQATQTRREVAEAIAALRPGDVAAQNRFLNLLQQAVLLLPVAELPPGHELGEMVTEPHVPLKVTFIQEEDGRPYLEIFTSEERLLFNHPGEQPYIGLPFVALAQIALTTHVAGIIIDRNGDSSALLTPPVIETFIEAMMGQGAPELLQQSSDAYPDLRMGPPPRVLTQHELVTLNTYLTEQPGLLEAYVFGVMPAGMEPMLTVGLAFAYAPNQERLQDMACEVAEILGRSGVLLVDEELASLLARQMGAIRFDRMGGAADRLAA